MKQLTTQPAARTTLSNGMGGGHPWPAPKESPYEEFERRKI
jgi:hypothetical protein